MEHEYDVTKCSEAPLKSTPNFAELGGMTVRRGTPQTKE